MSFKSFSFVHGTTCEEECYKEFLMENRDEILHNIDESLKSVDEKIKREEEIAWARFEGLNQEAPSDDEDERITTYRYSKISEIAKYLEATTGNLMQRKQELLNTRRKLLMELFGTFKTLNKPLH